MSVVSSVVLFGVFIIIYGIMLEIFTILFQLTGITREKARTQVISLLTNSGFTTNESEIVMSSTRRRRLARITMIFGYSFAVIIVSIMVNVFLSIGTVKVRSLLGTVASMGVLIVIYIGVMRIKAVHNGFNSIIEKIGNRFMFGKKSNVVVLMDVIQNKAIVKVMVKNVPESLSYTPLLESNFKTDFEIQIIYVKRDGKLLDTVDGNTVIQPRDVLLVFGEYRKIKKAFIKKQQHITSAKTNATPSVTNK